MKQFVRKLFSRQHNSPVVPCCPEGQRIYCVGDIHGRVDLLEQLHTLIADDAKDSPKQKTIIYLGDYIDRGDDSRAVIDSLLNKPLKGFEAVYLRGNHDQTLLDFLQQDEVGQGWLIHGGLATLTSYGVRVNKLPARKGDYVALQQELMEGLPKTHLAFLHATRMSYQAGSYYFVHAGIQPGIDLEKQQAEDQLWIREEFSGYGRHHEKIIVHGHSICDEPQLKINRIGLDTGAYMSGRLTALILDRESRRFIQTHA